MPDPSNQEQLFLELINRTRRAPDDEHLFLLGVQSNIQSAISFFGVNTAAFITQMAAYAATHPLAWNSQLADAADGHSQQMINFDQQSHQLPGEPGLGTRVTNAGYTNWSNLGENVYAYTDDVLQGHAGFLIDWGYDTEDLDGNTVRPNFASLGDGMQDPPGHRNTIMNAVFDEIGIGILADNSAATDVGPLVVTQVFATRFNYQAQFVGSVINDTDDDDFYDIGEGMGGVTVTAVRSGNGASYTTTTWASGGYQMVVPSGTYTVTFSGGGLNAPVIVQATMGSDNVYVAAENPAVDVAHDFNGDGRSDILWRHSSGHVTTWAGTSGGFNASTGFFSTVATQWQIAGDGDYNGDGLDDILWRNGSGALTFWKSTGTGFDNNTGFFTHVDTGWQVAGSGDFTGDGRDDIVWRNSNGALTFWKGTASGFDAATGFLTGVGTDWQVAGTGDFTGDGRDDILWRNTGGALTFWTGTGTGFAAGHPVEFVGLDWQVAGTGDFNDDGRDDILWRNSNGAVAVWTGTGTGFAAAGGFSAGVGTDWQIDATGDYNADGRDDVLWRHSSGALTTWHSTGSAFNASTGFFTAVPLQWGVEPDLLA